MRLIDVDALINEIEEWKNKEGEVYYDADYIIATLEDCRTAYDIDKVVKEIEKRITDSLDAFDYGISRATYEMALGIVKRGGIDDK